MTVSVQDGYCTAELFSGEACTISSSIILADSWTYLKKDELSYNSINLSSYKLFFPC